MSEAADWIPADVDTDTPSAARAYDYLLGGGHNFAADRTLIERALRVHPYVGTVAQLNRAFLRRNVLFLIEQGVRQFLDLGSGIPTVGNVHEIAQQADPTSRVVYVDYEDVAVAHSRLILENNDNTAILHADATDTDSVLGADVTRNTLDFTQPIGVLAVTFFHYVSPEQEPYRVITDYRDALAPGSYLALTHLTGDFMSEHVDKLVELMKTSRDAVYPRPKAEVARLFDGFELVPPGLVTTSNWRPESEDDVREPAEDGLYVGVGRKP